MRWLSYSSKKLTGAVVGVSVAILATIAQAGVIYTDQALFDAGVAGVPLHWSENFEGFTTGAFAGPLSIGSGQAEIFTDGPQQVYLQTSTGNQAYWNVEAPGNPTSIGPQTIIRGPGSSSFSVNALSFNYNMGGCRSCPTLYVASFLLSAGIADALLAHTSVSYPNGENGQDVPSFLGWIGAPGELLQRVTLTPRATGIVVDNIRAFDAVPAPATLLLFTTGLGMVGWFAKRKRRSECVSSSDAGPA